MAVGLGLLGAVEFVGLMAQVSSYRLIARKHSVIFVSPK